MPKQKFIHHPEGFKSVMPENSFSPKPTAPAAYQRHPITMHRGQWPNIESRLAHDQDEEDAAIEAGWSTVCPKIAAPEEPAPVLSLEDRVTQIEGLILSGSGCGSMAALIAREKSDPPRNRGKR
jgi:hypothetical protein